MTWYNKQKLFEDVRIEDLIDYFGDATVKKGSRISILCPCHNDNHYGSAYIWNNGIYCYACARFISFSDYIEAKRGSISFPEMLEILADATGNPSLYEDNKNKSNKNKKEKNFFKKKLSSEELEMIGLSPNKGNIYTPYSITDEIPENKTYYEKNTLGDDESVYYLYKKIAPNPLTELERENNELYKELVLSKANEMLEKNENILNSLKSSSICVLLDIEKNMLIKALSDRVVKIKKIIIDFQSDI